MNLALAGDQAAFLRVLEEPDSAQSVLVLLNKADTPHVFELDRYLSAGVWRDRVADADYEVSGSAPLQVTVPGNGLAVLVHEGRTSDPELRRELRRLQVAVSP